MFSYVFINPLCFFVEFLFPDYIHIFYGSLVDV